MIHPGVLYSRFHPPRPFEVATFNLRDDDGSQTVTVDPAIGKNQYPIAAIFGSSKVRSGDGGVYTGNGALSIGFFDGTNSACICGLDSSAWDPSKAYTRASTTYCLRHLLNGTGEVLVNVAAQAFVPNGVQMGVSWNATYAGTGLDYSVWVALVFDAYGQAVVGTASTNAVVDRDTTVTSGIPTSALIVLAPSPTYDLFDDLRKSNVTLGYGFVVPGQAHSGIFYYSRDGAGNADPKCSIRNDRIPTRPDNASGIEFSAFTDTGFTATPRITAGGGKFAYLALDLPSAQCFAGGLSTPVATGNLSITDPGSKVHSVLFATSGMQTMNSQASDQTAESFGVAAATEGAMAVAQEATDDNAGVMAAESRFATGQIYSQGHTGVDLVKAESFAGTSTGFQLGFPTSVQTVAKKWQYLAMRRQL